MINNDKVLLNNGIEIPKIAFGTFPQKEELLKIIPEALNSGFRLFDTSDDYYNEHFLGKSLKKNAVSSPIIVETKISNWKVKNGPRELKTMYNESLEKLELSKEKNVIKILLLHFPYPYIFLRCWREMEELYFQKKVDVIGVCNFSVKHLEVLIKNARVLPAINQIELHPMFQQRDVCDFCKKNAIQIMSYSPIARMDKRLVMNKILIEIAEKYKKSVIQIILRWNIQHGYIPVFSSSNPLHIKENQEIFSFDISERDMFLIDNLDSDMRIRLNPETMFGIKEKIKYTFMKFFT